MKKLIVLALCLALVLALAACGKAKSGGAAAPVINAAEAKALIDEGGITLVDVRRQDEYDAEHIEGAILVTLDTIGKTQPEALPDLDAEILVYCRTGVRSAQAAQALVDIGYTNVKDMGGITAWKEAGYPTVAGD